MKIRIIGLITPVLPLSSRGFFYYRHRIYDPNTGRFTSEDPLGFVDGANRVVYVGNNPINFIDPLGLRFFNLQCRRMGKTRERR